MNQRPHRNAIVRILGTPDHTEGSLNDPRTREEQGVRFNEKWTYGHLTHDPAGVPMRIIYWKRYDFMGTFVRGSVGESWRADSLLLQAVENADDRISPQDPAHNPAITSTAEYHPASIFEDKPDLGGRREGDDRLI
ncbi:MAG: hypothetical protein ACREP6_12685 [Candidatus Binataceae bacterium]